MTANPFRFGAPPGEDSLVGRAREVDELLRAFQEGRNLCLVGARGSGKTSLLQATIAKARTAGLQAIYVDLFPAISTRRFAEIYASALTMGPTSTVESMQEAVQQLVPTLMPRVTIGGSGKPGLQLDLWDRERDLRAMLERILEAPSEMAERENTPVIVVFDDFEDLLAVGGDELLQPLAQAVRRQRNVCTCFVLRREGTAETTFQKPNSPFFRLADAVALEDIPESEMVVGLEARFRDAGVSVEVDLLFALVQQAANVPHYVQLLAHTVFGEARAAGHAGDEHLRAALEHVLGSTAYAYRWQWDQLSTHQRNLVLAIAQGYTERLHSQRMVFQLGLGSPSTVSKNLRTLTEREILQRRDKEIRFVDPLFGLWLQRRMT